MNGLSDTKRRTVLKTIGGGALGTTALMGTAGAHGSDDWGTPSWLLTDVWEMADREPSGEDPTDHNSHVPIYYIAPGANPEAGYDCAQVTKDFSDWESLDSFKDGKWGSVGVDQTLHDVVDDEDTPVTEFSPLWHVHFVFEAGAGPTYHPDDLVNGTEPELDQYGPFINSGYRILAAEGDGKVEVVEAPFVFNCPARPAQGDHLNYCD